MEIDCRPGIVFRFRRPSGLPKRAPSVAMREALRQLANADEMQEFISAALAKRRSVVVEVFHSRDGHPLLVHVGAAPTNRNSKD